jgi:flagellar biosynthesis GTPase FlhF
MSEHQSKYYSEIINKLEKLVRKNFTLVTAKGLLISLTIGITSLFVLILSESLFSFSASVRTILFYTWIGIIIASIIYLVIIPLLRLFNIIPSRDYFETAKLAGYHFPFIKDELLNSIQLVNGSSVINLYSADLIDAAFQNIYRKVKEIDFSEIISFKSLKKYLTNFIVITFVTVFSGLFISPFTSASIRFFNYRKEFIPPAEFYFEVFPGNTKITKGENVELKIRVIGKNPGEIFLEEKDITETNFTKHKLQIDSTGYYRFNFQNVRNTTDYFVFAKDIKSDLYRIEVTDHPVIKLLEVRIIPPAYSKLPVVEQKDNGNITAIKGSKVEYKLIASKEIRNSKILFSDSTEVKLSVNSNQATGSIKVLSDKNYQIIITDLNNDNNLQPVTYSIKVVEDAYPSIELNFPKTDMNLPEDNRVPVNVRISDDFGFTKLILNYKLSSSRFEKPQENFNQLEIPFDKNNKEQFVDYIWNLTKLSPAVNDVFSFYLEVFDNDNVSGPKSAKTQLINLRVPSLDEILAQVDKTHEDVVNELQQTVKEAQELKKDIEQINRDLKQDKKELTWEEKQKIEKALDKFESLQDKMQSISEKLKDVQNELQQNKLLSKETLEKYMQLQQLMEEMTSDELKKALEQMRQSLEQMNRNMTQDQMKNMQIDEEKFKKSIERTMNLLKRIQIEQKIDEMLKRTERMNENQQELSKQTEKSNPADQQENENLSKQQNEISKELQNL